MLLAHQKLKYLQGCIVRGGGAAGEEVEKVLPLSCACACGKVEVGSGQHMDGARSARTVLTR